MSSPTPRSQIRLAAVTGSLTAISDIANQSLSAQSRLDPAGADQIGATDLEGILGQLAASVKRIQGDTDKDFTEVAAGVFKHGTSQFIGILSGSSHLLVGGHISGSGDAVIAGDLQVKGNDIKDSGNVARITMDQGAASPASQTLNVVQGNNSFTGDQGSIVFQQGMTFSNSNANVMVSFPASQFARTITFPDNYGIYVVANVAAMNAWDPMGGTPFPEGSTPSISWDNTGDGQPDSGTQLGTSATPQSFTIPANVAGIFQISSDIPFYGFTTAELTSATYTVTVAASGGGAGTPTVIVNADLKVVGNDIKDGNDDVVITMSGDGTKLVTLAGDFKVAGNTIKSSTADAIELSGADVEIKGDLKVSGNDIKASDGVTTITMSARDVVIAGDLQVSGNDIKASDGVATITMSARDVNVAGDLQVSGNDIKASDGLATLTMSGRDVEVKGDLQITGNDIKAADGLATITMSGRDVVIAGDLELDGNDIKASDGVSTISLNGRDVIIAGDLQVSGDDIKSSSGSVVLSLSNDDATFADKVNITGDAVVTGSLTSFGVISGSSDLQIAGNITGSNALFYGDVEIDGGDITTSQSSFNFVTSATSVVIGSDAGTVTVAGDLIVSGNDVKDSTGATRITFDDGVPTLVTQNYTALTNEETIPYSGSQGTITLPGSWTSVTIELASEIYPRSIALPNIYTDLNAQLEALASWNSQTYLGGLTVPVATGVSGSLTIYSNGVAGGSFADGSITVTSNAVTLDPMVKLTADLRLMGNDIRDSNNDIVISLSGDGQKRTIVAGDLEVDGNRLRASDGLTTLTMSGRNIETAGKIAVSGSSIEFVGSGAVVDAAVDLKTGGILTLRGGDLVDSVGSVALRMSGSTLEFSDKYMAGTWSDSGISLSDSTAEWQEYKNIFGEKSIVAAIAAGASGFGDGLHIYKAPQFVAGPVTLAGTSLVRPDSTTFQNSFLATNATSRNENVRLFLNGQLLMSKSFDSSDYDYDVAGDGSTIQLRFDVDKDDTIVAIVPLAVASPDTYVETIGYDLCGTINGKPSSSEVIFKLVMPRNALFNSGYAYADVAPSASLTMKIQKGVYSSGSIAYTDVGTITHAAGAMNGTVNWTGSYQNFVRGDIIRVVAPAVVDVTFSSPLFTLIGLES